MHFYQRGDASPACAHAHGFVTDLGTPYRINYVFEGKTHEYLPDFVGTLSDGGLLIAEAGRASEKSQGRALVKAEAARRLAQMKAGEYWIGTDVNLSERRHQNWLYLHARRQPFPRFQEIATALLQEWPCGEMFSVNELVERFGPHWSETEVEAAVWKLTGDTAAAGRLLVDLCEVELSHATPLAFLSPEVPPLLPDPLPNTLEEAVVAETSPRSSEQELVTLDLGIPGPTFDASALETTEEQKLFHHHLTAVTAVLSGTKVSQVANASGMGVSTLSRLVRRTKKLGQLACVPYATYHRDRALHPELQELIRKLYTQPIRPTVMAVYEDVQLKQMARVLSEREHTPIPTPTYYQVWGFLKAISGERTLIDARLGWKHLPQERTSPTSFVLSIASPALLCQVDEHTLDQLIVAADGTVLTRRVHGAVLICVKTAAILGAVLSLDTLREEDYMRLVKQTLEPKDRLTALYECKHPLALFWETCGHLSRPRENLHLPASHTGLGRADGDHYRASTAFRSISERNRRSPLYLGHAQIYPPSSWNHESESN